MGSPRSSTGTRPLTPKGHETRQRIVDAAARLIFEKGVAHTTIEDVRAAADVSSSQLYHYFDDKPALVRAVIDHQADILVSNQARFDLSDLKGLREWRDWVVALQRSTGCRGGCPIGSLGSELAESEDLARTHVAEGFTRWEIELRRGLREMQASGRLAPEANPDALALALLTALQGGLLLTQIQRDTAPLEAVLDSMLELIAILARDEKRRSSRDDRLKNP